MQRKVTKTTIMIRISAACRPHEHSDFQPWSKLLSSAAFDFSYTCINRACMSTSFTTETVANKKSIKERRKRNILWSYSSPDWVFHSPPSSVIDRDSWFIIQRYITSLLNPKADLKTHCRNCGQRIQLTS